MREAKKIRRGDGGRKLFDLEKVTLEKEVVGQERAGTSPGG